MDADAYEQLYAAYFRAGGEETDIVTFATFVEKYSKLDCTTTVDGEPIDPDAL